jgi:hypothetical protein
MVASMMRQVGLLDKKAWFNINPKEAIIVGI